MLDPIKLVVDRLSDTSSENPVTDLLGADGGIFGDVLPDKFDPKGGNIAIVVASRGGPSHPEVVDLTTTRMQITVWAGINKMTAAMEAAIAVHKWLHGTQNVAGYKSCLCVVTPQSYPDPDTSWATAVAFYMVIASG